MSLNPLLSVSSNFSREFGLFSGNFVKFRNLQVLGSVITAQGQAAKQLSGAEKAV